MALSGLRVKVQIEATPPQNETWLLMKIIVKNHEIVSIRPDCHSCYTRACNGSGCPDLRNSGKTTTRIDGEYFVDINLRNIKSIK